MDTGVGRWFWIAALALAACHSDEDDAASSNASASGDSTTSDQDSGPLSGEAAQICSAYSDRIAECGMDLHNTPLYAAQGYGYCASDLANATGLGAECRMAHVDYYACLSGLECAAFEDVSIACSEQKEAIASACGSAGESSSSG